MNKKTRQQRKKQKKAAAKTGPAVITANLICLADVEEQQTEWLWQPYLPLGKLSILEGDPDSGKSYLSLAIGAHLTTGRHLPFGRCSIGEGLPRNVLMLIGEDGAADTIKPRFRKLGGNMQRLSLLEGVVTRQEGKEDVYSTITLDRIPLLEDALKKTAPSMVVVDPFQCFLGQNVDLYRANETRPILSELGKLAERHNCAILLIRHLKKLGDKTIYRGIGSIDISAAARSVLLAGRNPQPPDVDESLRVGDNGQVLCPKDRFVLVHTKCNLGRKGPSIAYSIDDTGLTIDGISQVTDDDLLNVVTKAEKQKADDWLKEELSSGPKDATAVNEAAAAMGFGRTMLKSARERLGVIVKPSAFRGKWVMELPSQHDAEADAGRHDATPEPENSCLVADGEDAEAAEAGRHLPGSVEDTVS